MDQKAEKLDDETRWWNKMMKQDDETRCWN